MVVDNMLNEVKSVLAFMATGGGEKKKDKKKDITCYKCRKTGHYSNECDKEQTVKMQTTGLEG